MMSKFPKNYYLSFIIGMAVMFFLTTILRFQSPLTILPGIVKSNLVTAGIVKSNLVTEEFECEVPPLVDVEDFFSFGKTAQYICTNMKRFGGGISKGDGSKMVCFDDLLHITPGNCTVLSFGINNEWSFDDEMDKFGCHVYAFDPSMGKGDFNRSAKIHFYNLGISNFQGEIKRKKGRNWKMDRYENIIQKLHLTDMDIDYLKMDVEGSELQFLNDIVQNSPQLLKRVKQIGMEIHPGRPPFILMGKGLKQSSIFKYWQVFHYLRCLGFRIAHYEMNRIRTNHYKWNNRIEACCYEVLWVRVE